VAIRRNVGAPEENGGENRCDHPQFQLSRLFEVTNQNLGFWRFWLFVLKSSYGTQGPPFQQR
jgi:hypothetical protein